MKPRRTYDVPPARGPGAGRRAAGLVAVVRAVVLVDEARAHRRAGRRCPTRCPTSSYELGLRLDGDIDDSWNSREHRLAGGLEPRRVRQPTRPRAASGPPGRSPTSSASIRRRRCRQAQRPTRRRITRSRTPRSRAAPQQDLLSRLDRQAGRGFGHGWPDQPGAASARADADGCRAGVDGSEDRDLLGQLRQLPAAQPGSGDVGERPRRRGRTSSQASRSSRSESCAV